MYPFYRPLNMKRILQALSIIAIALASLALNPSYAAGPTEVVYHIDDAETQGLKGLRNIRNHLDVSPQTKIIVVTHANGVDHEDPALRELVRIEKNILEAAETRLTLGQLAAHR